MSVCVQQMSITRTEKCKFRRYERRADQTVVGSVSVTLKALATGVVSFRVPKYEIYKTITVVSVEFTH